MTATGRAASGGDVVEGARDEVGEVVEHLAGVHPQGVEGEPVLGDLLAGEVQGEGGDVVDVDLGADAAHALSVDLDGLPGPTDAAPLDAALADQAAIAELEHQAGDGGLVEAEVGSQAGPGPGAAVAQGAQDEGEVGAPQRHLVRGGGADEGGVEIVHGPSSVSMALVTPATYLFKRGTN